MAAGGRWLRAFIGDPCLLRVEHGIHRAAMQNLQSIERLELRPTD
jgi:hypothetical protein